MTLSTRLARLWHLFLGLQSVCLSVGGEGGGASRIIEIGKSSLRCDKIAEKSESLIYEHTQSSLAFLSLLMVLNGL